MFLGVVIDGPDDVIYFPGQGTIELSCNISEGSTLWRVNGTTYTLRQLRDGGLPNHNHTGRNIIIEVPVNGTEYICAALISDNNEVDSDPAFVFIAGECIPTYLHNYAHITTIL